ncbi:hypothetical protein LWI29_034173 [Acer saccharum]|uniref:Protein kinase domain-containing protein n=1 Tax=Acer saccharum TaxID=4024 RepID=A0AA39RP08_ACESA|nr:hypothetical protein LWI29_034173 [Acer saccharum]
MLIGEFPIQSVNTDNMKTIIEPKCNRSVQTLHQLYGKNFAPTARNAILFYDCDSSPTTCNMPSMTVQTQFQSLKCDSNNSNVISNISCYSEGPGNFQSGFLSYKNVTGQHCRYLMSSISAEAFDRSGASLDVQVVRLSWWIEGSCHCSKDAICDDQNVSPHGRPGFRCRCKDGFEGDGYSAGSGCRKASSGCGPVKFISGHCGGSSRTAVLIGGIATTVGGIMIICIIICIYKWMKNSSIITTVMFWKKTKNDRDLEAFIRNQGSLAPKRYSFSNVKKMTNSFKDKLGQGGFGGVYKGKLPDGQLVAVKLMNTSKGNGHDFINEVASISRTSHVNVVTKMASMVLPKKQSSDLITETNTHEDQESLNYVSSHLYLRPTHTSETLDKDVVLRRIRHRKRLNKVRNALQGFLGWSAPTNKTDKVSVKWLDDAFAAP